MDLFEETLAEVEGKDGERYVLRRNPARAEELAASRQDKLTTLRTAGDGEQISARAPEGGGENAALKLKARAKTLHIDRFVQVAAEQRSVALAVDQEALTELARLDGCYALRPPAQSRRIEGRRARPLQGPDPSQWAFRDSKSVHLSRRNCTPSAPSSTPGGADDPRNDGVRRVRKDAREEIRATRGDFKGHDIVGLRVWFEDRASGEMRPEKTASPFAPSSSTTASKLLGLRRMGAMTAREQGPAPRGDVGIDGLRGRDAVG